MHWRRKWHPTPVFLPGESQGRAAWWASVYGVAQSRTRLKQLSNSSREEGDELKLTGNEEATLGNIEQIHPELGKIDLYNASIFGHDL